jgi:hypothetical protein
MAIADAGATMNTAAAVAGLAGEHARKIQDAAEAAELNNTVLSYQRDLIDASDQWRRDNMANPADFAKRFEDESTKIGNGYLKGIKSSKVKRAFQSTMQDVNLRNYERNLSWQNERHVTLAAEQMENAQVTTEALAYRQGQDGGSLEDILKQVDATTVAGATFLAPEDLANAHETMKKGALGNYLQGLLATGRTGEAKRILDSGKYDEVLGGEGLARGYADIKAETKRAQAEAQIEMGSVLEDAMAEAMATGNSAMFPGEDVIRSTFGDKADKIIEEYDRAKLFGQNMTQLVAASPLEVDALLQRVAPAGEGYARETKEFAAFKSAYEERNKKLLADPNGYVASVFPEVQGAYRAYEKEMMRAQETVDKEIQSGMVASANQKLQSAIDASLEKQEYLGLSGYQRRVVGSERAKEFTARIMSEKPEERLQQAAALQFQYGKHWPDVYAEMVHEGLSDNMAVMLRLENGRARSLLAEADEMELKKLIDKDTLKTIDSTLSSELSPFFATVTAQPGNAKEVERTLAATTALAQMYIVQDGMKPAQAARKASADVIGRYEFIGKTRVPSTYNAYRVRAGLEAVQALAAENENILPSTTISISGKPADVVASEYRKELKNGSYFVTNQQEDGVLMVDRAGYTVFVKTENGEPRPYELKFRDLESYSERIRGNTFDGYED